MERSARIAAAKSQFDLAIARAKSNSVSIQEKTNQLRQLEVLSNQTKRAAHDQHNRYIDAQNHIRTMQADIRELKIVLAHRQSTAIPILKKILELAAFFDEINTFIIRIFNGGSEWMAMSAPLLDQMKKNAEKMAFLRKLTTFAQVQKIANQESLQLKQQVMALLASLLTYSRKSPPSDTVLDGVISGVKSITENTEIQLDESIPLRDAIRDILVAQLSNDEKKSEMMKMLRPIVAIPRSIFMREQWLKNDNPERWAQPIFFMGTTGSGKSTVLNHARGYQLAPLQLESGLGRTAIQVKNPDGNECKIGMSRVKSETIFPVSYRIAAPPFKRSIVDCPGFGDTRGSDIEICVSGLRNTAMFKSTSLSIVIILDLNEILNESKGKQLKSLANEIIAIGGNHQFNEVAHAFGFVFNKAIVDGHLATVDAVIEFFSQLAKTENDPILTTLASSFSHNNVFVTDPVNGSQSAFLSFLESRPEASPRLFSGTGDRNTHQLFLTRLASVVSSQNASVTMLEHLFCEITEKTEAITDTAKKIEFLRTIPDAQQGSNAIQLQIDQLNATIATLRVQARDLDEDVLISRLNVRLSEGCYIS